MSPGYKPLPLSPRLTIKLMNEEDNSNSSSSSSSTSSSSSSSSAGSVSSVSSTSSYNSTGGKRHIFGTKNKNKANFVKRRRPSEDPGKTAEREYKSIWKNKEQIFRGLERLEEISNSVQYEERDITVFTEEIEWLLEQITQKGKEMLGSSSTVAQLEAQQLIVDVEGASYTERSNGFLKEIFEEEVRVYERLSSAFSAVIDTADELDQKTAAWIEQTNDGVLTELELAQKSLSSILSKKSSSVFKKSKKRPILLRHESFIVNENAPVDQPPKRGVLQRQISVPHLRMPQRPLEMQQPVYRHKASSSTVSKSSVQLNNDPADSEPGITRARRESETKAGANRIAVTPPSVTTEEDKKKRKEEKEKEKDRDKKKKKKQKPQKESDGKLTGNTKGYDSKTDSSPRKDDQDEQKDKKPSLTKSKGDDSRKQSNLSEEIKTKPRKTKSNQSKTDLTDENEDDDNRTQHKKEKDDDIPDDSGDDSALDSEQDGKGHKMRSRFSKLAQVFHKSKKTAKSGSAVQSPITRPRTSSPQLAEVPPGLLLSSSHQFQESSSPPTPSLSSSAFASGLASTCDSVASPTQEQQLESKYKGVLIRTLFTLNLSTKDIRALYAMDDKSFIEYYESKILLVKEKLEGKD